MTQYCALNGTIITLPPGAIFIGAQPGIEGEDPYRTDFVIYKRRLIFVGIAMDMAKLELVHSFVIDAKPGEYVPAYTFDEACDWIDRHPLSEPAGS